MRRQISSSSINVPYSSEKVSGSFHTRSPKMLQQTEVVKCVSTKGWQENVSEWLFSDC